MSRTSITGDRLVRASDNNPLKVKDYLLGTLEITPTNLKDWLVNLAVYNPTNVNDWMVHLDDNNPTNVNDWMTNTTETNPINFIPIHCAEKTTISKACRDCNMCSFSRATKSSMCLRYQFPSCESSIYIFKNIAKLVGLVIQNDYHNMLLNKNAAVKHISWECEFKTVTRRTKTAQQIHETYSRFLFYTLQPLFQICIQEDQDLASQNIKIRGHQNRSQDLFICMTYELKDHGQKCQTSDLCTSLDFPRDKRFAAGGCDNKTLAKSTNVLQANIFRPKKYRSLYTSIDNVQYDINTIPNFLVRNLKCFSWSLVHSFLHQGVFDNLHRNIPRLFFRSQTFLLQIKQYFLNVNTTFKTLCSFPEILPKGISPESYFSKLCKVTAFKKQFHCGFMPKSFKNKPECRKTSDKSRGSKGKHRKFWWNFTMLFLLLHFSITGLPPVHGQGLIGNEEADSLAKDGELLPRTDYEISYEGTVSTCDKEGEELQVPNITDNPCIRCVCKNHLIECQKKRCKNVEGCHAILFDQPSQMCCEVCKGCRFQGAHHESGDSWRDKKDPCKQYSCRAGVISVSRVQCFSHCYNSITVPGQCCPVCHGCFFRGHTYEESETFRLPTDICTTCTCKNDKLLCEREQCPVLNCPPEVIFQPKNECCPQCKGQRPVFDVPSQCYFAKSVYKRNQEFRPDKCSKCVCKVVDKSSGTSVCEAETCPALDCPVGERHLPGESECCVRCVEKKSCLFDGVYYKNKEEWKPNVCLKCNCDDGVTYCQREQCSNSLWCPQGYRLLLTEKECCPKCIEHDAVCSVFGDPHYRTFDGLMYSFQGTCKYILTRDCSKNEFLIKVKNGVRFSSGFAWTQMLVVFVLKHRISLLQNSVVKVDKRRTRLPYTEPGKFSLSKDGEFVRLKTTIGLEVTWDGDSFLEVTVTKKYKHRLCGLCGNYNGMKSDDLTGKDGTIYMDGDDYGHSWRIGSTRGCKARPLFLETHPLCNNDIRAKQRAHRICSIFYSRTFSKCRQKVAVDIYVSSCITDMCDCPEGRYCACEAVRAYTSQCSRSGFEVSWDKIKNCQATHECPHSATRVDCSEFCPRSCENQQVAGPCPDKCLSGCMCLPGKVLHKGQCIPTDKCPLR